MKIKNTIQIIENFIKKNNFHVITRSRNFPMPIENSITDFSHGESLSYLLSASLTGNKSIGFFRDINYVSHKHFLKGECLLITTNLPEAISVPTIFCKKIDLFPEKLPAALKISFETKLPVMLVISENIINNYTKTEVVEYDTDRVTPYISEDLLENQYSIEDLSEHYLLAETLLAKFFDKQVDDFSTIAFNDNNYPFFDYIVPSVKNKFIEKMSQQKQIKVPENEVDIINYVKNHYKIDVNIETYKLQNKLEVKTNICAGCPFVSIFNLIDLKDKLVMTDVKCKTIKDVFNLNFVSVSEVAGYSCNMKNNNLCFIGNSSNFHPKYLKYLQDTLLIILKDIDFAPDALPKINKPNKLKKSSLVFPYSCNNIATYNPLSVKPKKCVCFQNGRKFECLEKTFCDAISVVGETVEINTDKCNGCGACKIVCPYGAIK